MSFDVKKFHEEINKRKFAQGWRVFPITSEGNTAHRHLREGLRLLRLVYLPTKRPLTQYEQGDMATFSLRELHTLEQALYELWYGQITMRYLRSELRRRALAELLVYAKSGVSKMKQLCLRSRSANQQEG